MCGIWFSCSLRDHVFPETAIERLLQNRGPDSYNAVRRTVQRHPPSSSGSVRDQYPVYLVFIATVLSLRGSSVTVQPLVDQGSGSVLCWNGEAWKLQDEVVTSYDGSVVLDALLASLQQCCFDGSRTTSEDFEACLRAVRWTIGSISGPFSFVFYDARLQLIFYGRDRLGRRSLLRKASTAPDLVVSSICDGSLNAPWNELEAGDIFYMDLANITPAKQRFDENLSGRELLITPTAQSNLIEEPTINISVTNLSPEDSHPLSIQKLTALPNRNFPLINRDEPILDSTKLLVDSKTVSELYETLYSSLLLRVRGVPIPSSTRSNPCRLAVLFSGGLDCSLLCRMVHEILPLDQEIDLLNVAFENPRVINAKQNILSLQKSPYDHCPDRITGLSTYAELLRTCPTRKWRFISIDIPYTDALTHRSQIISLIHPHDTEMDLSIAMALYFAARGSGTVTDPLTSTSELYITPSRVLLSGLGADELFGGYTRHTTAFSRKGYTGLLDELQLDFDRLGKRNLGRDDRVISHWGKEVRYPYLDEDFVSWALRLPVWQKCAFGLGAQATSSEDEESMWPVLEPNKHILRLLAWKLGMESAANEKKRAIQFGARTAKMTAGKTKGTQVIV